MQWQCRQTAETLASRMRADRDLYREVTTCRDRITSTAVRPRGKHGGGARAAEPLLCPAWPTPLCFACLSQLLYVATHARAPRALSPHRPPPPSRMPLVTYTPRAAARICARVSARTAAAFAAGCRYPLVGQTPVRQ